MTTSGVLAVSANIVADQWLYVVFLLVVYAVVSLVLLVVGDPGEETNKFRMAVHRVSSALETGTGYPGWAMAGVLSGLVMLGMAALGLYWDVAWHIDLGRDVQLFTPSHTMIVIGLGGLTFAAAVTVVFATVARADVGFRLSGLHVPWSALSLASLGLGGLVAFPIDALWHEFYGIDVTLWSPSHLMLVGGGSLATISVWLMFAEARHQAQPKWLGKLIQITVAGALLVGMSAFQGEFDFGVPQFQLLYWPLLVVLAAGFALVTTRLALGGGGALATVAMFLFLRTIFSLVVSGALNHTFPRFPLYIVAALAVEASAAVLGTRRPLRFAVGAGLAVSTLGLAAEVLFADASGWFSTTSALLPKIALLAPVAAVAAAVLGAGLARSFTDKKVSRGAMAGAGVALLATLVYPQPRNVGPVDAVIRLQPVGDRALVEVALTPPDAAERAAGFAVVAWQGGGRVSAELNKVGEGRYVSSKPLPITGSWKTMVGLFRGDQVMAAPVYLPADPAFGAPAIPALAERQTSFVRNTKLFLRETKPGPAWPAIVGYSGLSGVTAVWIGLFVLAVVRMEKQRESASDAPPTLGASPIGRASAAAAGRQSWRLAGAGDGPEIYSR